MRKFLASAAIIGLIAFIPPALAQDQEHHDQPGPPHGEQHGGPRGPAPHGEAQPQGAPAPHSARQANPGPRGGEHAFGMQNGAARREPPANQRSNAREPSRPARSAPSMAMRPNQPPQNAPADAMRGPGHRSAPNTAMRGPARDFRGVRNYHRNFDAGRHFHAAPYARPRGFYVHHWTWGQTLPPLFWARQYWLPDFAVYDLPPPPIGAVWVRVGDDALLIDRYNGMIIEVDYGVFY